MIRWGRLSPRGGPHLGSAGGAFQHHLHCLARHQLHPQRSKLKHGAGRFGALGGVFALGVTDGRETMALAKRGKTFCCPIELMSTASFVCYLEVVTARIPARREAEMENVMGGAISQRSPSFSTLMVLSVCTLGNKTTSEKADLAQSFSKSQTLVAPKFNHRPAAGLFAYSKEKLHEDHHLSCCGQSITSLRCSILGVFFQSAPCRSRCIGC